MKILIWEVSGDRSDFGRDYFDCDTLEQAVKSLQDDGNIEYSVYSAFDFEQDFNDDMVDIGETWCKVFE